MRDTPESISPWVRSLYDLGKVALFALLLLPVYLLLNQYWQSVIRLLGLYALLGFFCLRLAEYTRRAMRRLPAEIPPWHGRPTRVPTNPWLEQHLGAAEAIRSARRDPQYVQTVLKPRLQRLLLYRLSGTVDIPMEALETMSMTQVEPAVLDFLRRQEETGLWAKFRYRRQRVRDVLAALHHIEAL